jgi:hypothetical protein
MMSGGTGADDTIDFYRESLGGAGREQQGHGGLQRRETVSRKIDGALFQKHAQ